MNTNQPYERPETDDLFGDNVCSCGHWYSEHTLDGCSPGGCDPHVFVFSEPFTLEARAENELFG